MIPVRPSRQASLPATDLRDRFRGCLLGLAAGDAVGTTLEFRERGMFTPIIDMMGGGPFNLQRGQWTDDTSMALCLGTSLVEFGAFDAADQMNRYLRWRDNGYLSSTGVCFDIGNTVAGALTRYQDTGDPFAGSSDPHQAGNGSIMRLAPVPMFYYPDRVAAETHAAESSRTTHAAEECLDACRLLSQILVSALDGASKEDILFSHASFRGAPNIASIARGDYREKDKFGVFGTGYVVDSLEAALWCFNQTDTFRAAVLRAANLGNDADTTAAVCGQVAGAYYGASGMPGPWLEALAMRDEIIDLADRLME